MINAPSNMDKQVHADQNIFKQREGDNQQQEQTKKQTSAQLPSYYIIQEPWEVQ
jgi:hypothetical protein